MKIALCCILVLFLLLSGVFGYHLQQDTQDILRWIVSDLKNIWKHIS